MQKKNILLLGSYGRSNAGDDAFLISLIKLFRGFNITINSANDSKLPQEARGKIKTINTDSNEDLWDKMRIFLSADYIVYGGGDLWVELHGDKYPRTSLYKMVFVNLLSKVFLKKIFYIGCGAADLKGLSLALARTSAFLADYIIARDEKTIEILKIKNAKVFPDLTVNLFKRSDLKKGRKDIFIIGVSLLYFLPNPRVNFKRVVNSVCKLIRSLPRDKFGIVLIPMLISNDVRMDDLWASREIVRNAGRENIDIFKSNRIEDLVKIFSGIDLMIGIRLHSNILATLAGTPCLGISYRDKVKNFFTENSLGEYCLPLENVERLDEKFGEMLHDYDGVKNKFLKARVSLIGQKYLYEKFVSENFI